LNEHDDHFENLDPKIMMITSGCAIGCVLINVFVLGHGTTGECPHGHSHDGHGHSHENDVDNDDEQYLLLENSLCDFDDKQSIIQSYAKKKNE